MKYDSIFDVIGHIMVGPSSSHTAGACKIAYIAQKLLGCKPLSSEIFLHGSFAETYQGHGTDKALVAGLLGLKPDDERIRNAFQLAEEENLQVIIQPIDLGTDYHPNSVLLKLIHENDHLELIGSSIGGGNIIIHEIEGYEAGFNADLPTIIIIHKDIPGMISKITSIIAKYGLNINSMKSTKNTRKKEALTWIEVNTKLPDKIGKELSAVENIKMVRVLNV